MTNFITANTVQLLLKSYSLNFLLNKYYLNYQIKYKFHFSAPAHASLIAHSKQRERLIQLYENRAYVMNHPSWWELTQALYPAGAG